MGIVSFPFSLVLTFNFKLEPIGFNKIESVRWTSSYMQILYFKSESIEKEMNKEVCKVWNYYCCSTGKRGKKKWVGGGGGGGEKRKKRWNHQELNLGLSTWRILTFTSHHYSSGLFCHRKLDFFVSLW